MSLTQLLQSIKTIDEDLYIARFPDDIEIIFRLLSIKKTSQVIRAIQIIEDEALLQYIYRYIFEECVSDDCIYKNNMHIPAGVETSIAEGILYLSGAGEDVIEYTETLLEAYRGANNNVINFMKRKICSIYNAYKFSDLDHLNYQQLVEVFVNAEQSLIDHDIIEERFRISRPEEEKVQSIGESIRQDLNEYKEFNAPPPAASPDAGRLAQLREQRIRQAMSRGG